jgi:methyl-accepting chemotaxis protein
VLGWRTASRIGPDTGGNGEGALGKNFGLAATTCSVIGLLAAMIVALGYLGIDAVRTYGWRIDRINHVTQAAVLGEQVNGLILAVVMDSRGIYMARDHAEAEKFAPQILANLAALKVKMAEWADLSEPADQPLMDRAASRVDEFVRFRTELVRLSREASLAEAREYGDNDRNRSNREALNREMQALAAAAAEHVKEIANSTQKLRRAKLRNLTVLLVVGLALAAAAAALAFGQIIGPLARLAAAARALAAGHRNVAIPACNRGDEIGELARAIAAIQAAASGPAAPHPAAAALERSAVVLGDIARTMRLAGDQADKAVSQLAAAQREIGPAAAAPDPAAADADNRPQST